MNSTAYKQHTQHCRCAVTMQQYIDRQKVDLEAAEQALVDSIQGHAVVDAHNQKLGERLRALEAERDTLQAQRDEAVGLLGRLPELLFKVRRDFKGAHAATHTGDYESCDWCKDVRWLLSTFPETVGSPGGAVFLTKHDGGKPHDR